MAEAKLGDTVKVHYTGKFDNGEIFDSSENQDPLKFTIGQGHVIPGFENAVVGMNTGESKTEKIPAEDAYGAYSNELVLTVNKNNLPQEISPEIGQQLEVKNPSGDAFPVVITEITDETITLDANHPLAGRDLIFEIQLLEIEA